MRIVSLVPSATEMLFALGLGDRSSPSPTSATTRRGAEQLPQRHARRDRRRASTAGEIDRAVRERTEQGEAIYELDEDALRRAATRT